MMSMKVQILNYLTVLTPVDKNSTEHRNQHCIKNIAMQLYALEQISKIKKKKKTNLQGSG
jgi:hypothetical protein